LVWRDQYLLRKKQRGIRAGIDSVNLLITIAIPLTAVRALPCDSVAGHPPEVFQHAFLADLKPAATSPAEWGYT